MWLGLILLVVIAVLYNIETERKRNERNED